MTKYRSLFLIVFFICGLFCPFSEIGAQSNYRYSEDRIIKDGFHVAPVILSNKGYAFGVGYAIPLKPKLMFHGTLGYTVMSYLDGEEIDARGIVLNPSIIFFPDRTPNYKGIILGLEMPVMWYNMQRDDWNWRTVTGEDNTFVYQEYEHIDANAFQLGLGGKFGFRTHRRNTPFFWQPGITIGALYQRLMNYTEKPSTNFSNGVLLDNPSANQGNGFAPYFKLEVAFGLYRYKKERVKTLEL